tara:strand:+ start:251 stop:4153 length:3903 start_codon:yes stop_codon:yes gene_type:complete
MPREEYNINQFEGGYISDKAEKDLPENSCSDIKNLRVDKVGRLTMGPKAKLRELFTINSFLDWTGTPSRDSLFSYSSDHQISKSSRVTTIATAESGAAITVTVSATHSFAPGDEVHLTGTYNQAYDGYTTVKSVAADGLNLVLDVAFGSGQTNQAAHIIKTAAERDQQHNFLSIQSDKDVHIYDNESLTGNVITLQDAFGTALGGSAGNSDTNDIEARHFAVDGNLRIVDSNFSNRKNSHTRWYGYVPARPIGDYQDLRNPDETALSAFTGSGSTLSDNGGAGSLVQGMDFTSTDTSAGDNYVAAGDATASLTATRKIHVTFDMIYFDSGTASAASAKNAYPKVYFANANNVLPGGNSADDTAANNIDSEIKVAVEGLNHMEFTKINGNNPSYLMFFNTGPHTYKIRNLRITGNVDGISVGGFENKYYDVPATLYEPGREEIQSSLDDLAPNYKVIGYVDKDSSNYSAGIGIDPDGNVGTPYMAINTSTDPGSWDTASGGEHRFITLGMSWVYDGNQESPLNPYINKFIDTDTTATSIEIGGSTDSSLFVQINFASWAQNPRVTGARIYIVGYGQSAAVSSKTLEDPLLLATVNAVSSGKEFERGSVTWCDGSVTAIESVDTTTWKSEATISDFPALSYKIINEYDAYDNTEARWKCSTIVNRRLYVGNVRQAAASSRDLVTGSGQSSEEVKNFPDRMLRSPVGKFDTLPSRNEITVAGNDGESVIALRSYRGRILQFKQDFVYIINAMEDFEFIEDKLPGLGVEHPDATIETEFGVAWVSRQGVHLYDGQNVVNLIKGKVSADDWLDYIYFEGGSIGYLPIDKALVVFSRSGANPHTVFIYTFATQSWTKLDNALPGDVLDRSAGVNWHWTSGITYVVAKPNEDGETLTTEEVTANNNGRKATGSIKFSSGNLLAGQELYIKDSSNAARAVTSTVPGSMVSGDLGGNELAEALVSLINGYDGTSGYSLEAFFNGAVNSDQVYSINLTAKSNGASYNASGSASADELSGLYFDTDGTSPVAADSDGSLSNADFTPLSGGIDVVPGVRRFHINRNGNTDAGTRFRIFMWPWEGETTPGHADPKTVAYTTESGNDAEDVADGLIDSFEGQGLDAYGTIVKGGSDPDWYIQVTANWKNSTSTATQQSEGAYFFQYSYLPVMENSFDMYDFRLNTPPEDTHDLLWVSRDIDFGNPARRKKIYKVYITYKADGQTGVFPYYVLNGKDHNSVGQKKEFKYTSKYTAANGLLTTGGVWVTLELAPNDTSEANNIYSIKLVLEASGKGVPKGFEVNDVSIIYRKKSVK